MRSSSGIVLPTAVVAAATRTFPVAAAQDQSQHAQPSTTTHAAADGEIFALISAGAKGTGMKGYASTIRLKTYGTW